MRPRILPALISLCIAACAGSATAKSTSSIHASSKEKQALKWIEKNTENQIQFLEKLVNINSGTTNVDGVREVGAIYAKAFEEIGMQTEWIELPAEMHRAGHLVARHHAKGKSASARKRVLLIGHLDTVFEKSSPFQRFERDGHIAHGPGTVDMKGGNGVILYALRALHHAGLLDDIEVTVYLTGDEEAPGLPLAVTRESLIAAIKSCDVALGFESLVDHLDTATIARRGFLGWTLNVKGTQGHSSLIFSDAMGYGAIYESARILDGFRKALAGQDNLTLSPGRVVGGTEVTDDNENGHGEAFGKANIIAKEVQTAGDLRALTPEQVAASQQTMQDIVAKNLPGTSATLVFAEGYPPMAPTRGNQRLLELLNQINHDLGRKDIEAVAPMRRGAADISFAAPFVPSMGGLGLLGDGDHSPAELVDLRSVPVATSRAALLIYRLSQMPR